MGDAPETTPQSESPPPPEQPQPRRTSRAWRAVLGGIAVVLVGMAWAVLRASPWQSGITVESYRATVEDSKLEFCASGHFDQGLLGELLWSMGGQGTDQGLGDCVNLLFEEPLAVRTYRVAGQGEWRVGGEDEPADFSPREGHASALKRVWVDRGCFCMQGISEVSFDGTLSLTALDPPEGRLSLDVGGDGGDPSARIDIALSSFKWERRRARPTSLREFAPPRFTSTD